MPNQLMIKVGLSIIVGWIVIATLPYIFSN